jgi:DNA-binding response OmpR family regulator
MEDQKFILFVDSSSVATRNAAALRDSLHVRAEAVTSIREARERMEGALPDMLIVASELPDGSGRKFCLDLERHARTRTFLVDTKDDGREMLNERGIELVLRPNFERLDSIDLVRGLLLPAEQTPRMPPDVVSNGTMPWSRTEVVDSGQPSPIDQKGVALIVDSPHVAYFLGAALRRRKYRTHAIFDFGESIEWVSTHAPDIAFINYTIAPGAPGIELVRQIRTMHPESVIIYSNLGSKDAADAHSEGADLCIPKSENNPGQALACIPRLLRNRRRPKPAKNTKAREKALLLRSKRVVIRPPSQ